MRQWGRSHAVSHARDFVKARLYKANARRRGYSCNLFDNLQLALTVSCKGILPVLPYAQQLIHILLVHFIHIRRVGRLVLYNWDRPADDEIDRAAVRHHADIVIEDP